MTTGRSAASLRRRCSQRTWSSSMQPSAPPAVHTVSRTMKRTAGVSCRIGRDGQVGTRHERLGPPHEDLERSVTVDSVGEAKRLMKADHCGRKLGGDDADALAQLFVVAVAAKPGHS